MWIKRRLFHWRAGSTHTLRLLLPLLGPEAFSTWSEIAKYAHDFSLVSAGSPANQSRRPCNSQRDGEVTGSQSSRVLVRSPYGVGGFVPVVCVDLGHQAQTGSDPVGATGSLHSDSGDRARNWAGWPVSKNSGRTRQCERRLFCPSPAPFAVHLE